MLSSLRLAVLALCVGTGLFSWPELLARAAEELPSPPRPAARARAPALQVELVVVGVGLPLYARFGHAALLVLRYGRPELVYNYGLTDFARDGLVQDFLRGRATFWVGTQRYEEMVTEYQKEDRSVLRQSLFLDPKEAKTLLALLRQNTRPGQRTYVYHHFRDNCATRLRDLLDRTSGGRLRDNLQGRLSPLTWRQMVRLGFTGWPLLLLATELLVGRVADRPMNRWEALFLPRTLGQALQQVPGAGGKPLAGPPRPLYLRRGLPLPRPDQDPLAGVRLLWALVGASLGLALGLALAARAGRWPLAGVMLLLPSLAWGLCALVIWTLALASALPELQLNELALVLWPTDLLLAWVAVKWMLGRTRAGPLLRGYALARLAAGLLALLGHSLGLLQQQPRVTLLAPLALAAALCFALRFLPGPDR